MEEGIISFPFPVIYRIYSVLYSHYGRQNWWPGDSPFEVALGAILAQNTAWNNAALAIENLKQKSLFDPQTLFQLPEEKLASLIKPSGYYNQKAKALFNFLAFLIEGYRANLARMAEEELYSLRRKLLSIKGIGPETADSILLYALNKPIFVVDGYTMRIGQRHRLFSDKAGYDKVQQLFMKNLPCDSSLYNEYHALIVRVGKEHCRKKGWDCSLCPLGSFLP
jgi:endonuclease-3 related protein